VAWVEGAGVGGCSGGGGHGDAGWDLGVGGDTGGVARAVVGDGVTLGDDRSSAALAGPLTARAMSAEGRLRTDTEPKISAAVATPELAATPTPPSPKTATTAVTTNARLPTPSAGSNAGGRVKLGLAGPRAGHMG
jgi:hypothetical protein